MAMLRALATPAPNTKICVRFEKQSITAFQEIKMEVFPTELTVTRYALCVDLCMSLHIHHVLGYQLMTLWMSS